MGAIRREIVLDFLKVQVLGSTLIPMQACNSAPSSPDTRSFAGLLADFASPEKKFPPARDLDGLQDDIATISYEQALKAHARCRPAEAPKSETAEPLRIVEVRPELPFAQSSSVVPHPPLRKASVTVRLSQTEDGQLRQRAAEAGMTVSAYLRSCAFEVESLRSQVKQTLAEMRHPAPAQNTARRPLWGRLRPWKKAASTD